MPPLPAELLQTLLKGQWKTSRRRQDHYRRSIYIFARRNLQYPLFATFDRPAANCSCAVRDRSTTPVQSLLLLNSKLTLDAAQRLAEVVTDSGGETAALVDQVYVRVLSRLPDPAERTEAVDFLRRQTRLLLEEGREHALRDAVTDLCRAMFNSNAFLYGRLTAVTRHARLSRRPRFPLCMAACSDGVVHRV